MMEDLYERIRIRLGKARRSSLRQGVRPCVTAGGRRLRGTPYLNGHIVILGGGKMAAGLLNAIARNSRLKGREVLLMSAQEPAEMRNRIVPGVGQEAGALRLTFCMGRHNMPSSLEQCQIERASYIFIIGEDGDIEHDAANVDCWNRVRNLRTGSATMAQCYLYLLNDASAKLFHKLPQYAHNCLETTIINHYEAIAQQLLSGDEEGSERRTLDRGLVTMGSDRYVHFVIAGMTPIGYALANTAAHLCHFPNFDETSEHPIRTKITFVDAHADEEMESFVSLHQPLFALSHRVYRDGAGKCLEYGPDRDLGDFLDVEWEFIKGAVVDGWVRKMLESSAADDRQVLSVALCGEDPEANMEQAVSLPAAFYRIPEEEAGSADSPVVYVYQPANGAILDMARMSVLRYRNVLPFGMDAGSYDPMLVQRVAAAKRLNYLCQKEGSGKEFVSMPVDSEVCDDMWRQLSFDEKMSNIYAANASNTMLRSLGLAALAGAAPIDKDAMLEELCRQERARWNIEKLLVGYSAMPIGDRRTLNAALQNPSEDIRQEARIIINRSKNQYFVNKDIAPYSELPEVVKVYEKTIMRNLPLSMLPAICKV